MKCEGRTHTCRQDTCRKRKRTYLLLVGLLGVLQQFRDHLVGPIDAVLGPLQQHVEGLRPTAVGITADGYLDKASGLLHQLPLLGPAGADEETDEVVSRELLGGDGQLPRHLGGRRSSGGGASARHGGQQSLLGQVGRPGHGGVDAEGRLLGGRVVISVVAPPLALGRRRRDGGSCGNSASSAAGRPERHGQRLLGRPGRGGVDLDHSPGGRSRSGSSGGGVAGLGSGGGHGGGARKAGRDGPGAGDGLLGGGHDDDGRSSRD